MWPLSIVRDAQTVGSIIETELRKQPRANGPPTVIKISTGTKTDYPLLSFVDYWLWAYCRHTDRHDNEVLPAALKDRTRVKRMSVSDFSSRPADV
jgi:hypothetical protein